MTFLFLLPIGLSHPLAGQAGTFAGVNMYGHAIRAELWPGRLELEYVLEAPLPKLSREAETVGETGFVEHKLAQIGSGLRATLDGVELAWEPVVVQQPSGPGDAGLVEFRIRRRAELPASGELRISNGNHPDESALFAANILVDGQLVVEVCSLVDAREGRLTRNHHAAWLADESARELVIQFRPASWWERGEGLTPLPLRHAELVPGPPWGLAAAGLGIAAVGVVGLVAGARRRRRHPGGASLPGVR